MRARLWRRAVLLPVAASIALVAAPAASADDPFFTSEDLMITLVDPSTSEAVPIISVGDEIGDDYMFEGIPDGIGAMPGPGGSVEVFVSHEQSRVPFRGFADYEWSSVSHLTLDETGGVLEGSVPLTGSAGFQRFCSSTMAGPAEGLSSYLYFTGEEAPDRLAVPADAPYGPDPAYAPANDRQSGYAVVLDPVTGDFTQVAGMGRHNHENSMVLPGGWDQIAVLSGDDTFSAPSSQLYLYLADDEDAIWADQGSLWAFRVTHDDDGKVDAANPFNGANDYGDISEGEHFRGRYIRVPTKIAKGLTAVEPQKALEDWSNAHNVFQFIRVEDTAYDPRVDEGENPVMYFTDTGSGSAVADPTTGRLRGGGSGSFGRGRVFRMEFAADNPKKVLDFSILLNGDTGGPVGFATPMSNPDNMGTSENSLMVQEDTSSTDSRIWRYDFETENWSVVAVVNDRDWETSGIVDVSEFYGPGAWLFDVQAHDVFVGPTDSTTTPDVTYKREGGQLVLLTVDNS